MLKTIISLSFGPLICLALLYLGLHIDQLNQQMDSDEAFLAKAFIAFFFLVFVWASLSRWMFHSQKKAALATKPVSAHIDIIATPRTRGPDSLVAEIELEDGLWRAILSGFAHDRFMSGKPGTGKAWLHPETGAPLAVEFGGKRLSIVPKVVKVDPDSLMEKVVQKARSYPSDRKPAK